MNSPQMKQAIEAISPTLLEHIDDGIVEEEIHTLTVEVSGTHRGLDVVIGYMDANGDMRERRAVVDSGRVTDYTVAA